MLNTGKKTFPFMYFSLYKEIIFYWCLFYLLRQHLRYSKHFYFSWYIILVLKEVLCKIFIWEYLMSQKVNRHFTQLYMGLCIFLYLLNACLDIEKSLLIIWNISIIEKKGTFHLQFYFIHFLECLQQFPQFIISWIWFSKPIWKPELIALKKIWNFWFHIWDIFYVV